jgi:multiple antibiotic resistance protein
MAREAVLVAGGVLIGFVILGQLLLQAMHISIGSFQVAGGLVLFLLAMMMIFGHVRTNQSDQEEGHNPAIFPLAMPLIAGPGAILAAVVLTDNDRYAIPHQVRTVFVILGVLFIQWVLLRFATSVQRRLGRGVMNILSRVMGLLLAALSVETIVGGVRLLLHTG